MKRLFLVLVLIIFLSSGTHGAVTYSSTSTPIQHIIIIMQENHSFDNYFGTYPTGNGTISDAIASKLQHVAGIPNGTCLPYRGSCISPHLTISPDPQNPVEGQLTYEMDYSDNGTGFPNYSGPQSMVYFDYHSIAAYWDYAEEYGIGDSYFAPVLGMTTPNRLMLLAGDTPVSNNSAPPPYVRYSETVMGQLDEARVTWGYFDYYDVRSGASGVYPFNYVSGVPPQSASELGTIPSFLQYLARGAGLPSVSFVNSLGNPELDEHPSTDPTSGELWVESIINQVMLSIYWPTTVIFVTWDEGGGYYDHVRAPEKLTINHDFANPLVGFGQRVPLLVVSPYAKENFVSHETMSHLSLLHFIEYNWALPPLNELVARSYLPLSFFNFSQTTRPPLVFAPLASYPLPLQGPSSDSLPLFSTGLAIPLALIVTFALILVVSASKTGNFRRPRSARDNSSTT